MKKLLIILLFLLAACATEPATITVDDPLVIRPNGALGTTVVYDRQTGEQAFTLPTGRISAEFSTHITAQQKKSSTILTSFDTMTGKELDRITQKGTWEFAGLSPNGRWAALAADGANIRIVDMQDKTIANEIALKGDFEVEAISNDGASLYLIEHLEGDDKYRVRLYDLAASELQADALRDKRIQDELMTGYAWGTVQDPQGEWLLTLYVNTARNAAFIHALNLNNSVTFCLDLPSEKASFATLQQYTMTLSPDRQTIYAANPALGIITEISLVDIGNPPVTTRFKAVALTEEGQQASVISADNRHLFFSQNDTVWHYDIQTQAVNTVYQADNQIDGLALADGMLFVAHHDGKLLSLADRVWTDAQRATR